MVEIPSIHDVIETTSAEGLLSLAADVAVAWAVADDPDPELMDEIRTLLISAWQDARGDEPSAQVYWDSVRAKDPADRRWRELLVTVAEDVEQHRQAIILADLCIDSAFVDDSDLVSGPGGRRINGVLDTLEMPFAAADAQDFFAMMAQNLADMKSNYVHELAEFGAAFAGGFAGGWFGIPGANQATMKGVSFFTDEITRTDECSLGTAALLTCALAATEFPGGEGDLDQVRRTIRGLAEKANDSFGRHRAQSANVYTGDAAQADRQRRILNAALGVVNEISGDSETETTLPRVTGMTLSSARDLLTNMGIQVTEVDDSQNDRWVMNATNWRVVRQAPQAGDTSRFVTLYIKKYGE